MAKFGPFSTLTRFTIQKSYIHVLRCYRRRRAARWHGSGMKGLPPHRFDTRRSCGQSTHFRRHQFPSCGHSTIHFTYYLLAIATLFTPLRFVRPVQQSDTLLPHTLVPRGLCISVIERQNLHCRRNLNRCRNFSHH